MPISPELADSARSDIYDFLRLVLEVLDLNIREPHGTEGPLILEGMIGPLNDAWTEFQQDFSLGIMEQQVFGVSGQTLQDHGLYGAQIAGKRRLVDIRISIFNGQRTKRALIWLLDAIDTYLDSVIDATGLSGSLKEIKDMLRNSIDG